MWLIFMSCDLGCMILGYALVHVLAPTWPGAWRLCFAVLCCAVLCCAVLCCAVLCCAVVQA